MKNMTKQKRRKLEKKRRQKKQERKLAKQPPLAYYGNKYRSEKYVYIMLATETAIHEADVVGERTLKDSDAKRSLAEMITRLRKGDLPALEDMSDEERRAFGRDDFLTSNISAHWEMYFEQRGPLSKDTLIGVLRTILGSIEFHRSNSPSDRGYLTFLEDFLNKMGVTVQEMSREEFEQIEPLSDFDSDDFD